MADNNKNKIKNERRYISRADERAYEKSRTKEWSKDGNGLKDNKKSGLSFGSVFSVAGFVFILMVLNSIVGSFNFVNRRFLDFERLHNNYLRSGYSVNSNHINNNYYYDNLIYDGKKIILKNFDLQKSIAGGYELNNYDRVQEQYPFQFSTYLLSGWWDDEVYKMQIYSSGSFVGSFSLRRYSKSYTTATIDGLHYLVNDYYEDIVFNSMADFGKFNREGYIFENDDLGYIFFIVFSEDFKADRLQLTFNFVRLSQNYELENGGLVLSMSESFISGIINTFTSILDFFNAIVGFIGNLVQGSFVSNIWSWFTGLFDGWLGG